MEFSTTCNCPKCLRTLRLRTAADTDNKLYEEGIKQMKQDTDTRATAWSVTLFNGEEKTDLPEGWKLEGQMEACPDTGKQHYQGFLKTKQVRFSSVKKVFPKAHIEKARDEVALQKYVHKKATRVAPAPKTGSLNFTKFFEDVFEYCWDLTDRHDMQTVATLMHDVKMDGTGSWLNETVACMIKAGGTWDYAHRATDPKIKAMWNRFRVPFLLSWLEEQERAKNEVQVVNIPVQDADDNASIEQDAGGPVGRLDIPVVEGDSEGSQDSDGQDDSDSEQDSETGDSESD